MTSPRSFRIPGAWVRGAIGVAVLFVLLELLTRAELVTPQYLPPASSIIVETFGLLFLGSFWSAFWATMQAVVIGLLIASVIAIPLGMFLGLSKWAYQAGMTVVEIFRPIPSVSLIALAIIVLGRGLEMKVYLVVYACIWPILFNAIYGMHSVDPVSVDTARAFGLNRFKIVTRVQLRSASPFIFTGIKIASAVALILAVSAEIVAGGAGGLGIEMSTARELGDLKASYAFTIMTGVVGLTLHLIFEFFERRWFSWNVES